MGLLRLIYHAHFWNKQFNLLATIALLIEMIANICIVMYAPTSIDTLKGIFVTKLCMGLLVNSAGIIMLKALYKDKNYQGNQTINFNKTFKEFIKHSNKIKYTAK